MKRVLVIGGSYFIGKAITKELQSNGYEVTLLNRGSRLVAGTKQLSCDRNEKKTMKSVLEGKVFDYLVDVSGLNKEQAQILCDTLNMEELKSMVFISSSAVYDVEHLKARFREQDRLGENKFWGQYGTDKIEAERTYCQCMEDEQIPLVILRPPYVYGEENYVQRENFIFEHILQNKPVIVPATNKKLQFIYAKDLAVIVRKMLEKESRGSEIYNVGNSQYVTAKEWVQLCAQAMGKAVEIVNFDYKKYGRNVREFFPFHDYDNVLNVDKIQQADINIEETDMLAGLQNAYKWFLEQRLEISWKKEVKKAEAEILKEMQL